MEMEIKMVKISLTSKKITLQTKEEDATETTEVVETLEITITSAPEEAMETMETMETMDMEITNAVLLSTKTVTLVNSSVLNTIVHLKIMDVNHAKIRSINNALCTTQTPVLVTTQCANKKLLK